MLEISQDYKDTMKASLRNKTFMRVSIGLINQRAQNHASFDDKEYAYFSNVSAPLGNERIEATYASYEMDYCRVDGSQLFIPRNEAGNQFYNAGLVTKEMTDTDQPEITIHLNLDDPVDVKGLTIDFGNTWPEVMQVITDNDTKTFSNNSEQFITETVFEKITFITIRALSMSNGIGRLHINKILFGIGIFISDEKIIEASFKNEISPISERLPTADLDITIDNLDGYYDVDNRDSAINYMEAEQKVEVYMGQKLLDNRVEWYPASLMFLKKWSADAKKVKFSAVDIFDYMQGDYKKGSYYEEGISLYDLAVAVFTDAGKEVGSYRIDPYLKSKMVKNPLPCVSHKECIQIIANAGRCVVAQSRTGLITIKSSFSPDVTVTSNQEEPYGTINHILLGKTMSYASFEKDFIIPNEAMTFLPRGLNYQDGEYVSINTADAAGNFDVNPIITISLESEYSFNNLSIMFGNVKPDNFIIRKYRNGEMLASIDVGEVDTKMVVYHNFIDVDKLEIEFTKASAYNRVHVQKIAFGDETDYELTYDLLMEAPTGKKLEKIKDLTVCRSVYTKGIQSKDLVSEEVVMDSAVKTFEFKFSKPVHDMSVQCYVGDTTTDFGAFIEESGSYWCKVRINTPPSSATTVKIVIVGYEFGISPVYQTTRLNTAGATKKWENPLISTKEQAEELLEWIGTHYLAENEYDLKYRGEPALDANDLVFLESKYEENMMIRIESLKLKYKGSMSGEITGRRYG